MPKGKLKRKHSETHIYNGLTEKDIKTMKIHKLKKLFCDKPQEYRAVLYKRKQILNRKHANNYDKRKKGASKLLEKENAEISMEIELLTQKNKEILLENNKLESKTEKIRRVLYYETITINAYKDTIGFLTTQLKLLSNP